MLRCKELLIIGLGAVAIGLPLGLMGPSLTLAAKRLGARFAEHRLPMLEQDAEYYAQKRPSLGAANDCFPVKVRAETAVSIEFLHCTDPQQMADAQSVQIAEGFTVDPRMARRFNFWRRIYSLWTAEQYVMHVSEYPEVVLEAFNGERLSNYGPIAREAKIKKLASKRREQYRSLLTMMHHQKHEPQKFTAAMRRVATIMAHIKDPNKYLVAARNLRLQRGQKDFIAKGLSVAGRYLPAIEKEFAAQGIPVAISRLAFVESSFNLKAQSKVGASGVYQIMPATGRQYLTMSAGIDERNDPIKASRAACRLLKLNYKLTGSWPLAITAYNHGVGGINRAMRTVQSRDIHTLIERYEGKAFGFASKNFYASFLGVLATLGNADKLFPDVARPAALAFEPMRLSAPMTLANVAKKHGTSLSALRNLNPDLTGVAVRSEVSLPKGYVVKLPHQTRGIAQSKTSAKVINAKFAE